jgi:hypothetical protein
MASTLSKGLRDSLSDALTDLNNMAEALREGKDITKDLANKTAQYQKQSNKLALDQISLEAQLLKALQNRNVSQTQKIQKQLTENKFVQDQIEKQLGAVKLLGQQAQEEKKIAEEKKKQNNLADTAIAKLKDLTNKYLSLSAIFKMIVDAALRFNSLSVDISKNIGYGTDKADAMASRMLDIAQDSSNINVTLKNVGEAMTDLNKATGLVAEYSADALETQIMLTKQFGLTGEEAAGVYKLSVLTGKSSEKVNDEMVGAFVAARNASKAGVSFQATIAAAAKVSGQLKANLQADPAGIVKAVVTTTALGTSLEQTAAQGEKLLNFASSIESELNAELLTGKQLNLERARAAALAGDQVALAEELNRNIGSYEDFTKMNVLQQKALADAVGLTADQLANQLEKQKLAREAGKSLAEFTKDEALEAQKRQKIQDKFNQSIDKLKDLIGNLLAGPFGMLLDVLTDILAFTTGTIGKWVGLAAILFYASRSVLSMSGGFKGMVDSSKSLMSNVSKLFSKEGRSSLKESIFGGGDKVKETAETTAGAGGKVGAGGAKAGDGIKNTLKGISAGIQSFSKVSPADIAKLAFSALALVALTPAIPALLALQFVNGKLIQGALTGVGNGLAAFGKAVSKAAPEILIGELLLAGLGLALSTFVPIVTAIGDVISTVFTSIANGVSTVVGAIGDMIVKLGETGPALLLLGPALFGIAGGLAAMGFSGLLALPSIIALTALGAVAPALADIGIGGGGKGEEGKGTEMTELIAAVKEVKAAVDRLYSKDQSINMDGKKVGTTLVQGSYKVA